MNENQPKRTPRKGAKQAGQRARKAKSRKDLSVPEDSASSEDEAEFERIVEKLPPKEKERLLFQFASHRGWLPPPAMLREYEEVLPGLAERVVAMPEREQSHRHAFLDRETERQYRIRRRGQDYALISVVLVLIFAVFLAVIGQPVWAARLVIATLVGVVGIFVTGRWLDRRAATAAREDEED